MTPFLRQRFFEALCKHPFTGLCKVIRQQWRHWMPKLVHTELKGLHEGNFARFRLRPAELDQLLPNFVIPKLSKLGFDEIDSEGV